MAAYIPVARGDQDNVSMEWWVKEGYDIPPGTMGRTEIHCGPLAYLFDLAGAEQTIGKFLGPDDAEIIDCHCEGGVGYIDYRVTGAAPLVIVLAIIAGLAGLGIIAFTIVSSIQISKVNPTMFSWQLWLIIIAIIAAIVVMVILVARKGRMQAGKGGVTVGK